MGKQRRSQPRELAGKLRIIREKLDISQEQLAERLKEVEDSVYPGAISRYERGVVEPSLIVLLEYARLVGVSTDVLIDDKQSLAKKEVANRARPIFLVKILASLCGTTFLVCIDW